MECRPLVETLPDPSVYPHAVDVVEVRHTHISVVFPVGWLAYKIKKPVDLDFVDYSTLERREGRRVLIDASFREESQRRLFLDAVQRWRVAGRLILRQADPP
jgi:hypothetical protein